MKTLKFKSKKAQAFLRAYINSSYRDLSHVYKTYSRSKHIAHMECLNMMTNEGGFGFRILSWNTFQFTCAWQANGGLRVETARNSYFIDDYLPF